MLFSLGLIVELLPASGRKRNTFEVSIHEGSRVRDEVAGQLVAVGVACILVGSGAGIVNYLV